MNRRLFVQSLAGAVATAAANTKPRNVLFIAIDDMNDWIGCLDGHPQAQTPNLDRLASKSTLFTNAHCAAPLCNPSRAAVMTGIHPSNSGVYLNNQPWRGSSVLKDAVTLTTYLNQTRGYRAIGAGKIHHGKPDQQSWDDYWPSKTRNTPESPVPAGAKPANGIPGSGNMDWGPVDAADEEMGDLKVVDWVGEQLSKKLTDPLFLGCGLTRPHLPWYVPKKYFDLFPLNRIELPPVKADDLDDVPPIGRKFAGAQGDHKRITGAGKYKEAVQAYLASIAFADAAIGRLMRKLETSPNAGDFSIVLWSDHGWHLGEKLHWRKFALWEESTRNVLMISAPGVTSAGRRCARPVSLLDLYPTLSELCGAPVKKGLDGVNRMALLKNPAAESPAPVLTTYGRGNHALRDERWRYIKYSDATEELYDRNADPQEWTNLAAKPEMQAVKDRLAKYLPKTDALDAPVGPNGE